MFLFLTCIITREEQNEMLHSLIRSLHDAERKQERLKRESELEHPQPRRVRPNHERSSSSSYDRESRYRDFDRHHRSHRHSGRYEEREDRRERKYSSRYLDRREDDTKEPR